MDAIVEKGVRCVLCTLFCRKAPGTLMARQGKGMDLFHSGVTLVKSTVEGRAALMADNRAAMIHALVMHDHALRTLLPKYCGYEVGSLD